ncbi:MAG: sialidase family protein [bacterium]|nr:sialidase family protein [bacterium]
MKAFLVMLVIVSLGVAVHAQPQAPVVWGEARWAYLAGWPGLPQITTNRVIPMGDTLLFTAVNMGSAVSDTILVCSSFDNGQTFTPWLRITQGDNWVSAHFTGSSGRYYCFFTRGDQPTESCWLRVSEDGGQTWGAVQQYREHAGLIRGFASGTEVLAKFNGLLNNIWSQCVIRSTDGGRSWSAPLAIDTANFYMYYYDQTIAFTAGHRLILEKPAESLTREPWLYVARGDSTGQNWTTFQVLPCQYYDRWAANRAAIAGDTSSEVAGVLGKFLEEPFEPDRPLFFRTTDGGSSWESCIALTEEPHVIPWWTTHIPINICQGKLWLVGWEQLYIPDTVWGDFLGIRFSANHAKNWYPIQMAADSLAGSLLFSGQIRGNQIDLYWAQGCFTHDPPWDYRMVTGTITPDTTFPELAPGITPPETVRVRQQLDFSVVVTDNDTLSEVRLVIVELSGDTLRYGMARGAGHAYSLRWVVPDSGYYSYWFEAEDFWENIATLPDSGTFHFVTEGWSASADFILHPSSFPSSPSPSTARRRSSSRCLPHNGCRSGCMMCWVVKWRC